MEYLDFDVELVPAGDQMYHVIARSPVGEADTQVRFPFDERTLEQHLLALRIALLHPGEDRHRARSPEEHTVQAFGHTLFNVVLPDEVNKLYTVCRFKAAHESKGIRLRLHILDTRLAALPWEYLYHPQEQEYLSLSKYTPIIRYLNLPRGSESLTIIPPIRILGMIASPNSPATLALAVENEKERLEWALSDLKARGIVELSWVTGQTWRDLQQAMWRGPWHIFHFIGHGGFNEQTEEGTLALAQEDGQVHLLSATHFGRLLADQRSLRLVVLNACEGGKMGTHERFSSVAATLAQRGVPAIVAMQEQITDRAALELTRTFYEALAHGLPIDSAVAEARIAINVGMNNSLEWGTPVLYLRAADGNLFPLQHQSASLTPHPPPSAQPISGRTPQTLPGSVAAKTAEQWIDEALVQRGVRRFGAALAAYEEALRQHPEDVIALLGKGNVLWEVKRVEEARAVYDQAFQLPLPEVAVACYHQGIAFYHLKQYNEAYALFERAIRLDPTFAWAYNGKGTVCMRLKLFGEALVSLDRAVQLDPYNANFHYAKGGILDVLGQKQEAQKAYRRARELGYKPHWLVGWILG